MLYTRRELGQLALAGLPSAAAFLRSGSASAAALAKPESKWAGVQVGMNVPYNFGMGNYLSGDEILTRCVQLGVSGVELRMQPVELFLGSPDAITAAAQPPPRADVRRVEADVAAAVPAEAARR